MTMCSDPTRDGSVKNKHGRPSLGKFLRRCPLRSPRGMLAGIPTKNETMMNIRKDSGQALVEFAVVVPVFLLMILGTFQFGLTVNNYVMLTEAVRAGGRQFALSRGVTPRQNGNVNGSRAPGMVPVNCSDRLCTTAVNGVMRRIRRLTALGNAAKLHGDGNSIPAASRIRHHLFPVAHLTSTMTERAE